MLPVWFDIDGTLLHTRAGHEAFRLALQDVFGWEDDLAEIRFAGNTDLRVLMDLTAKHGGDADAVMSRRVEFFECMGQHLDNGLRREAPTPVPGATDLVNALQSLPALHLGLLTGNARVCAYVKLRHVQLDHAFATGGFGDEHPDRDELARRARDGFHRKAHPSPPKPGLVVGDTVRDVRAAKAIGARCLAVATGPDSAETLLQAGADRVEEHLGNTRDLLAWVLE